VLSRKDSPDILNFMSSLKWIVKINICRSKKLPILSSGSSWLQTWGGAAHFHYFTNDVIKQHVERQKQSLRPVNTNWLGWSVNILPMVDYGLNCF